MNKRPLCRTVGAKPALPGPARRRPRGRGAGAGGQDGVVGKRVLQGLSRDPKAVRGERAKGQKTPVAGAPGGAQRGRTHKNLQKSWGFADSKNCCGKPSSGFGLERDCGVLRTGKWRHIPSRDLRSGRAGSDKPHCAKSQTSQ